MFYTQKAIITGFTPKHLEYEVKVISDAITTETEYFKKGKEKIIVEKREVKSKTEVKNIYKTKGHKIIADLFEDMFKGK